MRDVRPRRPRRRRIAFALAACALPLLVLGLLEIVARLLVPPGDPFVTLDAPVSIFSEVEEGGRRVYKITHPSAYRAEETTFPVEKAPGTLRVFCLGGSASAGWPHPPDQTWSAYFRHALSRAYPDRAIEVVNAGAHAFASYRVRGIFDDVIRFAPDLIVIYCGNNEFVERRAYLAGSSLASFLRDLERHSRLVAVANGWLRRLSLAERNTLSGKDREDAAYHLWSHTERVASELRSDPAQFAEVLAHYRHSLSHMVETACARGVPVAVLTVPVNLRDWTPNVSRDPDDPRWRAHWLAGRRALLAGDAAAAVAAFDAALGIAGDHAETWFWRGRAAELGGASSGAYAGYLRAKDLDLNPFRAPSPINETIRSVAAANPRAILVEAEAAFRERADRAAPGFDLFVDYVHPSKRGNELLAELVYGAVAKEGVLGAAAARFAVDPANAYTDDDDLHLQITLLGLFSIMHQYEGFLPRLEHLLALCERAGIAVPAGPRELLDRCRDAFTTYLENERNEILGRPFDPGYRDAHKAFYKEFFGRMASMKVELGK